MATDVVEILLVEDNPADVRLTEEALRESGRPLHLSVAPDGVEALAFLRREGRYAAAPRPDLVLLDLNLPRKGGREVLAEVKADPALRAIPVVVLTTSQAPGDVHAAYDLRANCYLTKAGDVDQFFDAMAQLDRFWLGTAQLPPRPATTERDAPGDATVLVVDDDPDIVDLLAAALGDRGYRVLSALGTEALRLAREEQPGVVLLDMNMPTMDGAELSRRLRDDPATAAIPVVMMSAQRAVRASAALLPVTDWLPKPFDMDLLYATVARWTTGPAAA